MTKSKILIKNVKDSEKELYDIQIKNIHFGEYGNSLNFSMAINKNVDEIQVKEYAIEYLKSEGFQEETDYKFLYLIKQSIKPSKYNYIDKSVKEKGYYIYEGNLHDYLQEYFGM